MNLTKNHNIRPIDPLVSEAYETLTDTLKEEFHERAAIIEFDSNLPRDHGWMEFLATADIIEYVMRFSGGKVFRKPSSNIIVSVLCKICPSITRGQKTTGGARHRGLFLPKLHVARAEFEKYIGGKLSWSRFNG